jgi:ribosomal protein S18 acetylase RimI-like enzyme
MGTDGRRWEGKFEFKSKTNEFGFSDLPPRLERLPLHLYFRLPRCAGRAISSPMEIRSATPQDVPAVLPMVAAICALHESWDSAKYGFVEHPEQRYARWLPSRAGDPRAVFLVADAGDRLAGFLIGTIETEIPIYRLKEFGFIHDVWVEAEYRHEGVGRQLTMAAVGRFHELGMKQVRLDTAAVNEAARKLFQSCGFRPSTIEMLLEL